MQDRSQTDGDVSELLVLLGHQKGAAGGPEELKSARGTTRSFN